MTKTKQQLMQEVIVKLQNDVSHKTIQAKRKGKLADLSLINHFALHELIPNKWFDWERRVDAPIMIIGQDWGPYVALKKYVDDYESSKTETNFSYDKFLLKTFSSRTEKFIMKTIQETYVEKYGKFNDTVYDNFFFTMAVLFTRQGKNFRGNEFFDEIKSRDISYPFVARQIEIVQPKVIMTLGNLGFSVVNRYYNLGYDKKNLSFVLKSLAREDGVIQLQDTVIIPNYHPAAHIDPNIQKDIWRKVWTYIPK